MPSFYRFNIAQHGRHHSKIDNEWIRLDGAKEMLEDYRKRFPADEGFEVTLTYWECLGNTIEA